MNKSEKMDRAAVRTAADIEEKYNFGKSFAEALGVAEDARNVANEAKATAENVDKNLDHEEIFNRLTNNGEIQGLKEVAIDGKKQIYFNASYIKTGIMDADRIDVENLFANDINMTGTFTSTAEIYLPPTDKDIKNIEAAYLAGTYVEWYDLNGDGKINVFDASIARSMQQGLTALNFPTCFDPTKPTVAKKMPVTLTINLSDGEKIIHITGENMWGSPVDSYIGVNFTNIKNPDVEDKLDKLSRVTTLWSGMFFMNDTQLATLNEGVSKQKTGIVLKWEVFNPDTQKVMAGEGTHYTFVPKTAADGNEVTTGLLISKSATIWGKKTVFVHENTVEGYADNSVVQSSLGITLNNHRWVLTAVYGV